MSVKTARAVLEEELDDFLEILCTVYDLHPDAAAEIFFSDPTFDLRHKRVLIDQGEIVSVLTVVPRGLKCGDGILPVAGIAGVATPVANRGRGYATELIRETLHWAEDEGYAAAALQPIEADFYDRFGFAACTRQPVTSVPLYRLRESDLIRHIRPAVLEDIPQLTELYERWCSDRVGCAIRDETRWRALFTVPKSITVFEGPDSRIAGYAIYGLQSQPFSTGIEIVEWVSEGEEAAQGLAGLFAAGAFSGSLEYVCDRDAWHSSGLESITQTSFDGAVTSHQPPVMVAALDLQRMVDVAVPGNEDLERRINLCDGTGKVMASLGSDSAMEEPALADPSVWTRAAWGSVEWDQRNPQIRASEPVIDFLRIQLPYRSPFLSAADYF